MPSLEDTFVHFYSVFSHRLLFETDVEYMGLTYPRKTFSLTDKTAVEKHSPLRSQKRFHRDSKQHGLFFGHDLVLEISVHLDSLHRCYAWL